MNTTFIKRSLLLSLSLTSAAVLGAENTFAEDAAASGTTSGMAAAAPSASAESVSGKGTDAATEAKKSQDTKLKPGVVASYGKFDKKAAVDGTANGNIAGEQQSPVSGSVKFVGGDRCEATVANLSDKDSYSVSFDVVGSRGSSKAFSRGYSATLKPKESVARSVSGCSSDLNVQVVLKSGRKIGK